MDTPLSARPYAVLDSITQATRAHRGKVLVAGSHGGDYCGWYAVHAGLRAVILHDAGVGLEQAGIRCLDRLERAGMPAATVSYLSARIGDGRDMAARGVVSFCNGPARALGVISDMPAAMAARFMASAGEFRGTTPPRREARRLLARDNGRGLEIVGLDSNSLVEPGDAGRIVITGSHGGLLGGRPASAVGSPVRAAAYNDAGGGIDDAGYSRLPALDARGIPAMTVRHDSARIGDALSSWETGVVSRANATAGMLGVRTGMTLQDAMARIS
ncbi:hypothetical protein ACTPOE_08220 [Castellaniella sp. WN]